MSHHNVEHKTIPTPTAMNIIEAKAGGVQIDQSSRGDTKSKKSEGKTVHVSTKIDLCHLQNSELENKFKKKDERC